MLSRRERLAAVAAGMVLGALALDRLMVTPLLERRAQAADRVAAADQALRTAEQVFHNDLRARRRWKDLAGDSLAADAPTAESQVLHRVHQWAQESGLTLASLKPERNEVERGFQRITIRATGQGTMQQTARFLFAVQNAPIPLRISDLQIVTRREGADDLSLQVGLSTIYLPPPAPPPRGAPEAGR